MRATVLFLCLLTLLAGLFVGKRWLDGSVSSPEQDVVLVDPEARAQPAAGTRDPEPPIEDSGFVVSLAGDAEDASARTTSPDRVDAGQLISFTGYTMLQPKGQTPVPANRGRIDLSVLVPGAIEELTVDVVGGRFEAEIPERSRVVVKGGVLNDERVRFLGFSGPRTIRADEDYAMIGEPVPLNVLRVFDGVAEVALAGVTIRRAQDGTAATLEDQAFMGKVIVEDAPSPIELPYVEADHPVWIQVAREGYAPTTLLIDPREAAEHDVSLWPAASLTVRVTGPGRSRLKALTLKRSEPGGALRHFATVGLDAPGIVREQDAFVFPFTGVPALQIQVEARGFDPRGRTIKVGEASIGLGALESRTVQLRIEAP